MKKIKPDIIMLSSSQQGQTGPRAPLPGTGNQLTALSGFAHLAGWPDREPALLYGGYTDCQAARVGALVLIAALLHRKRTGQGQILDVSQFEAGINFIAPVYFDYVFNGRIAGREGNRAPAAAPHGVYSCAGEDRWCAIAVTTEAEWRSFCRATGSAGWQDDPRFATLLARKKHEDELDELVAGWTSRFPPEEVMQQLQAAGVAAGVVATTRDLLNDPQLKYRNYYWEVNHPVIGKHRYDSQAFELSRTPRRLRNPAPRIGEHNYFICNEILGMPDEEFAELVAKGVLGA